MVSHKNRVLGDYAIKQNSERYRNIRLSNPAFRLTPEGALHLKEYLALHKVDLDDSHAVKLDILQDFLFISNIVSANTAEKLIASEIYSFLAEASEGYWDGYVVIDPVALNALATSKERAR